MSSSKGNSSLYLYFRLEDIEKSFEKLLMKLWGIKDYILDVKETHWHDEYGLFKQAIKDLEVMMQNIVQMAMEDKGMLTRSLEMLEIFHSLAKREAIRRTVEKKASEVWARLIDELKLVKEEFETNRKAPAILRTQPDFSGSAYWAKSLLKKISFSMDAFKNATFLPQTAIADDAKALYDSLAANLDEYITKTHHDWINVCQISLKEKLDQPLMVKNGTVLNINYDKDLARIFSEINYFQKLKCDVPFHLLDIYRRKDDLRHLRDNLLLIVRDYK
jgi:dynein heavy chain